MLEQGISKVKNNQLTLQTKQAAEFQKKEKLWQNSYSTKKFTVQLTYLLATIILWFKLVIHTVRSHQNPIAVVVGFISAQFAVDFISGLLHWACDTWGKFETPIVGPTLIRSFRMHHVDPLDITRHGFIQTNASSSYPMPFFIIIGLLIMPDCLILQTYNWMVIFGVVSGIMTNQIHKWAHTPRCQQNSIIKMLQKYKLIINHEEHHRHHQNEFDQAYCIINGWMNPILEKIDFWRRLQTTITYLTGHKPRNDDNFWRKLTNPYKNNKNE